MKTIKLILIGTAVSLQAIALNTYAENDSFLCELNNNKAVFVNSLGTSSPWYQYGTDNNNPELTLNSETTQTYYGEMDFAGGSAEYIRFTNGEYSYQVYFGEGRGWNFLGLAVYKGHKKLMKKECIAHDDVSNGMFRPSDFKYVNIENDDDLQAFGYPHLD